MSIPVEIVKALVSPAEKLIVAVRSAIGKMYEPYHLKKVAEAKQYERLLDIAEHGEYDLVVKGRKIKLKDKYVKQYIESVEEQTIKQLLRKQYNKENIANKAYDILIAEETEKVNSTFNDDWMEYFFEFAQNIKDEDMQNLWARILAGEIKTGGSFSIRSLSILSKMSKQEALVFDKVCKHAVKMGEKIIIPQLFNFSNGYCISSEDVLLMEECGVIHALENLEIKAKLIKEEMLLANNDEIAIFSKYKKQLYHPMEINIKGFNFTKSGSELIKIIDGCFDTEKLLVFAKKIKKDMKDFDIYAFKIIDNVEGRLVCDRSNNLI